MQLQQLVKQASATFTPQNNSKIPFFAHVLGSDLKNLVLARNKINQII